MRLLECRAPRLRDQAHSQWSHKWPCTSDKLTADAVTSKEMKGDKDLPSDY